MRKNLLRLQKEGTKENAAYILMQRIFPSISPTILVREGIYHKDHAVSELGVYGAYLRYITCASKNVNLSIGMLNGYLGVETNKLSRII